MPRSHKKLQRLYVQTDLAEGLTLTLDKPQAHYLGNVLRRKEGDEIVLFNGRHGAFLGRLAMISRKAASVVLVERIADQPAKADLWYGFAPLKTGRLDYMVQKATEMGVTAMQPVMTEFTQVTRIKYDRMQANVIEAAEQCEVLGVPAIMEETGFDALLEVWETRHGTRRLVVADEEIASASPLDPLGELRDEQVGLLIGPEGGFSEAERDLLREKDFVVPISLGPRILRADTAAVAALAVMQSIIGDWR